MALTAPTFGGSNSGTSCTVRVQCVDLPLDITIPLTTQQIADLTDADLREHIDALVAALAPLVSSGMQVTGGATWEIYGSTPAATA